MTHRHDGDPPAPERSRFEPELEEKTFLQLIPRRDITKVVLLVVLLVAVVAIQRRSGSIIQGLTRGLTGPPPPAQVTPKAAPKVRLAPPQP
jgi:hypothetical protein